MKIFSYIITFSICLLFFLTHEIFAKRQEGTGLSLEIEVISRASLSISTANQTNQVGNNLKIDFGNMDAFGINRNSGVLVETTALGTAYYQNLKISTGTTGNLISPLDLKITLLNNTPNTMMFFEGPGPSLVSGQMPPTMRAGQTKTIISNLSGFKNFDRILGIIVKPETSTGKVSAQIQYSLESAR